MARAAGSTPGPVSRRAATCCLVLLLVPAGLVAAFWYDVWQTGRENDRREQRALASIAEQAQRAARDTARAMAAHRAAGADALTDVIWRHTEAPVITYDAARRTFTATASRSAVYEEEPLLLGAGPVKLDRCFRFTFTRRPGAPWSARVTARADEACAPSDRIRNEVVLARIGLENLSSDADRAAVRRALEPAGRPGLLDVRSTARTRRTITATVLVHAAPPPAATWQCYRLTRDLGDAGTGRSVTAVPVATC
ncbi:hypothetical protein AB0K80_28415 [Streptomyces sp. NPDC052682]|uniref:hypothetical protein n=1 Tax=Streptomyces sp. NPDC052682 TaxID=3154954 RepID=UPI00342FA0BE